MSISFAARIAPTTQASLQICYGGSMNTIHAIKVHGIPELGALWSWYILKMYPPDQ
jgi:hypothetical protein